MKSFAISKSGMQGTKDVRTRRPDTPSDGGRTWFVAGCPNDEARLAHFKSMIRTTYPDRICYCPGVMFTSAVCFSLRESDRGARHMSSWGIRMELIRIAMRTPCHQGERSLHLAHTDDSPRGIAHSTGGKNSVRTTFHLFRISHIWMGEEDVSTSPVRHIRIF